MLVYLQMIETPEEQTKFETVYLEYKGLMYYVANQILHNEADAEDAVHQAFLYIVENIKNIDEPVCNRTKSYVVTIAESRAIDAYRRKARRKEVPYDEGMVGICLDCTDFDDGLSRSIAQLPPRYREVIILKHRHGYSNKEIAKILGLSESNAIKLDQRAKHKLLQLCEKEELL